MDPRIFLAFATLILGGVLLRPLVTALAERIRHRPEIAPEGAQELVEEVRAMRQELAELAERVDFTERLLAKGGEPVRLEPRGS